MRFFATFWEWLNGQLAAYIGDNTARVASALEPAVVTLATIYVMVWGYLHLTGKIEEPLLTGVKRILLVGVTLGMGLQLWLYNTVVVDTFYNAPAELAATVVGGNDPVAIIDTIWERGGTVAGHLWDRGSVSEIGFVLAGAIIWCLTGLLCVYAMFLISLSRVALAVLLALGPMFITMWLFETTRRLCVAWMAQLTNYALITILTVMVAALLLKVVQSYAIQTAALGAAILTVDALNMALVAVLAFLVLRQVMPIASGLSGGVSLNSFGLTSRGLGWGFRAGETTALKAIGLVTAIAAKRLWSEDRDPGVSMREASTKSVAGNRALGARWRERNR
jgi:type IV secretion system protein VirB6